MNGTPVKGWLYGDQLRIIAELDGTGTMVSRFVYATRTNVPDYMIKAGVTYKIITDQLGSPRMIVDASTGALAQQIGYDEFGNVLADTSPSFQPFGFAGGLYDPDTKLVRFGARDYDPQVGRWTAKDPVLFDTDVNLYGYVFSDPVSFIDIDGLRPGDPYRTRDSAARNALFDICGRSRAEDREYAGYVYRQPTGNFSYTAPQPGTRHRAGLPSESVIPAGARAVGVYHTHGDYSGNEARDEEFSLQDRRAASRLGIPNYLATPSGTILRFTPYPRNPSDDFWFGPSFSGYTQPLGSCGCEVPRR